MKKTMRKDANFTLFITFLLREEVYVSYTPVKDFFAIFSFNTKGLCNSYKRNSSWKLVSLEHCCDVNSLCI